MATETTATDAAAHATEAHHSVGLPQLNFETWGSQIFWLAVALVVLYFLMSRIALPRIGGILDKRADTISDDIDRATALKVKAEEAGKAYEAALASARAEANRIAGEARKAIQKDLDAAIAEADAKISARAAESERRIGEIRDGALASVEAVATETAEAIVAALLPGTAESAAVAAAVKSRLG